MFLIRLCVGIKPILEGIQLNASLFGFVYPGPVSTLDEEVANFGIKNLQYIVKRMILFGMACSYFSIFCTGSKHDRDPDLPLIDTYLTCTQLMCCK